MRSYSSYSRAWLDHCCASEFRLQRGIDKMESLIGRLKPFRNKKTNANTAHTILYIEYFKRIVFGAHVSLEYVFVYYLCRVLFKRPLSPFPFICPHAFFPYKVFSFSKLYKKFFFCFCSHTILYTVQVQVQQDIWKIAYTYLYRLAYTDKCVCKGKKSHFSILCLRGVFFLRNFIVQKLFFCCTVK